MKRKRRRVSVRHRRRSRVYAARVYRGGRVARRFRGRRRGGFSRGGGFKSMLAPIAGGVADAIINPRSPIDGIGSTAIGFVMHDPVVKTIGLYQVGQSIAGFIPVIGSGSGGGISQV